MYPFLRGFFPKPLADALMVLWYTVLIVLVILFFHLHPGEFRYINI